MTPEHIKVQTIAVHVHNYMLQTLNREIHTPETFADLKRRVLPLILAEMIRLAESDGLIIERQKIEVPR